MSQDNGTTTANSPPTEETIAEKAATDSGIEKLSVQRRTLPTDDPLSTSASSVWWFIDRRDENALIAPWWSPRRDTALRLFWKHPNNDILQGAVSSMVKKFTAMNWVIEGPQRVVTRYRNLLLDAEFWQGWGIFLSKTLQDYLTQDKGAFWEKLGAGDPGGARVGPVLGLANLDSQYCQLTGDIEFPVIYHNPKTENAHALHNSRVVHLVDMPSPNEEMNNVGFCAVSRVIGSSEILLKMNKYKNEKLDDLPEAGLLLLNNVLPQQWEDTKAEYSRGRRNLNQQIWSPVMTLMGLDPAQPTSAELVSFANLPESFNETDNINTYINILALAFGVDAREFWPLTGGALGTATESEVMHQKARGKGVGDIISTLERAINWHLLPKSATFRFDFTNDEEDQLAAEIDKSRTDTIMSMWKPGDPLKGTPTPVSALEIRQMLADNVSYFKDDFLTVDMTVETEGTDNEAAEKAYGPLVQVTNNGEMKRLTKFVAPLVEDAVTIAMKNYERGQITAEQIAEYALGELIDRR